MEIFFVFLVLALIAALAAPFGHDTQHLNDNAWNRDGLWSRTPRV